MNKPEMIKRLRQLLDERADWGHDIERLVPDYDQLTSSEISFISEERLKKLWWASQFAETGSHGYPRPNQAQSDGLRTMTTFLADRSMSLGERFYAARKTSEKVFKKTQLPVILRTLLILEGGQYGTITTKRFTNILLKWARKQELNYNEPISITEALQYEKTLIEEWSPLVGATTIKECARIPWHVCQIVEPSLDKTNINQIVGESSLVIDIRNLLSRQVADPTILQTLVNARVGQGKFGLQVRKIWNNRCAVTGSVTIAALEAAHIKRWADSTDDERLDPYNGLLLTANFHRLFDAGLISFEDSGKILISSKLSEKEQIFFGVVGKRLSRKPSVLSAKYLFYQRSKFLK